MNALRVVSAMVGVTWLVTAGAKIVDPEPAYELISTLAAGGDTARVGLAAVIAAETALGGAMVLGLVRGFAHSLGLIALLSAAAWWVSAHTGPWVRCGCLGGDGTVDDALARNVWVAAVLTVLLVADVVVARRRRARPA